MTRDYTLQLTLELPPAYLVVNVRLVATRRGKVVVCETEKGWRTLPGGSRERGEHVDGTARRELMEEARCRRTSDFIWFASFTVTDEGPPWRVWHPFPVSAWLVGSVEVDLLTTPTNRPDGERVVTVQTLDPLAARDYLSAFDNGGQAELVALAADLGHLNL